MSCIESLQEGAPESQFPRNSQRRDADQQFHQGIEAQAWEPIGPATHITAG
jgi:hypothetical protein